MRPVIADHLREFCEEASSASYSEGCWTNGRCWVRRDPPTQPERSMTPDSWRHNADALPADDRVFWDVQNPYVHPFPVDPPEWASVASKGDEGPDAPRVILT